MRVRFSKLVPNPWLILICLFVVGACAWIHHRYYPTWKATVILTPSGDAALLAGDPDGSSSQVAAATLLAEGTRSSTAFYNALIGLNKGPELRTSLCRYDRDLGHRLDQAEGRGQSKAFAEAVHQATLAFQDEEILRIQRQTGIPKAAWHEFLYLESFMRQHRLNPALFRSENPEITERWYKRVATNQDGRTVKIEVSNRDPHLAVVLANAIAVASITRSQEEALAHVNQSLMALDQQQKYAFRQTTDISRRMDRIGLATRSVPNDPILTWQLERSRNKLRSIYDRICQAEYQKFVLQTGAINVQQWAGVGHPSDRVEAGPLRVSRFASGIPVIALGIAMIGLSWVMAMTFHLVVLTARSLKASRSTRPTSPAREMVAARDEDF